MWFKWIERNEMIYSKISNVKYKIILLKVVLKLKSMFLRNLLKQQKVTGVMLFKYSKKKYLI